MLILIFKQYKASKLYANLLLSLVILNQGSKVLYLIPQRITLDFYLKTSLLPHY